MVCSGFLLDAASEARLVGDFVLAQNDELRVLVISDCGELASEFLDALLGSLLVSGGGHRPRAALTNAQ